MADRGIGEWLKIIVRRPVRLACSNLNCESHKEDGQPMFNLSVTVDDARDLSDVLKGIEPEHFTCDYCGSQAEAGGE